MKLGNVSNYPLDDNASPLFLRCCASTTASISPRPRDMANSHTINTPVLVLFIIEMILLTEGETACNASKVAKGSSAKITCYFDRNTRKMEENIFMEHLSVNPFVHEIVVSCQVVEGRYICKCNDGYRVLGDINDEMAVEIPTVLPEHAGIYLCGGFEPNPLERTQCNLNVTNDLKLNDQILDGTNNKLFPTDNDNEQDMMNQVTMPISTVTAIISGIVATEVVCALIIAILIIRRRRVGKLIDEKNTTESINSLLA